MNLQLFLGLISIGHTSAAPILFRRPDGSLGIRKGPYLPSFVQRDAEPETWTPPAVEPPASTTPPASFVPPEPTKESFTSGINYRDPLGSGLTAAADVFADTLQSYGHALQDGNSSPVLDTFYTAISGVTKELSVVALTFRKVLDPTDWDTVHTIGRLFSPIVNDATSSAQSVANKIEQYGLGNSTSCSGSSGSNNYDGTDYEDNSQSSDSHIDRLNGLRTYVNALKDLSTVARTYDLDITTLDATITRIETVISQSQ